MASNETANYHLNQWEAGDTVLRTDFNADNEKLEAALTALSKESIYAGILTNYDGSRSVGVYLTRKPVLVAVGNRLGWTNIITGSSSTSRPGHAVALPGAPGYFSGTSGASGTEIALEITSTGFTLHPGMDPDLAPYYYVAFFGKTT